MSKIQIKIQAFHVRKTPTKLNKTKTVVRTKNEPHFFTRKQINFTVNCTINSVSRQTGALTVEQL